jgi:pimeloyl-ACP methyl ester carboxylesterase
MMTTMRSATVNGVNLMYEVRGTGEPLVLSHCSFVADAFAPLMDQPALGGYQLIRYHRRGWGGSSHPAGPCAITDQAADLMGLLEHLGVRRAHVAGHSLSGLIALQLAADQPEMVASLALLEVPLMGFVGGPIVTAMLQRLAVGAQRIREGDREGAVDSFSIPIFGQGYRDVLEHAVPGSWARAVSDADTFFAIEQPAMQQWRFGAVETARITMPVLSLIGSESSPTMYEYEHQLQAWFPQLETGRVVGVNHLMQIMQPRPVAEAIAGFLARHPLG